MRKKINDSKFAMPTRTIHHLWKNHASNFSFKRKWNLHFEKYASRCHPAIPIFLMLQHSSLIDQACFRGGAKKNIVLLCYISCQFLCKCCGFYLDRPSPQLYKQKDQFSFVTASFFKIYSPFVGQSSEIVHATAVKF